MEGGGASAGTRNKKEEGGDDFDLMMSDLEDSSGFSDQDEQLGELVPDEDIDHADPQGPTFYDFIDIPMSPGGNDPGAPANGHNPDGNPEDGTPALEKLARRCLEDEILDLETMYGGAREMTNLAALVQRTLSPFLVDPVDGGPGRAAQLPENHGAAASSSAAPAKPAESAPAADARTELARQSAARVLQRVREIAPRVQRFAALLDEEQEREFEKELEEEVQIHRPPPARGVQETVVSEGLRKFASTANGISTGLIPLSKALEGTGLQTLLGAGVEIFPTGVASGGEVFVTENFRRTVESSSEGSGRRGGLFGRHTNSIYGNRGTCFQ